MLVRMWSYNVSTANISTVELFRINHHFSLYNGVLCCFGAHLEQKRELLVRARRAPRSLCLEVRRLVYQLWNVNAGEVNRAIFLHIELLCHGKTHLMSFKVGDCDAYKL